MLIIIYKGITNLEKYFLVFNLVFNLLVSKRKTLDIKFKKTHALTLPLLDKNKWYEKHFTYLHRAATKNFLPCQQKLQYSLVILSLNQIYYYDLIWLLRLSVYIRIFVSFFHPMQ